MKALLQVCAGSSAWIAGRQHPDFASSPRITGTAVDKNGKPMAQREVTLVSNGKTYVTSTDGSGHFTFRSSTIEPGKVQLTAGAAKSEQQLSGAALTNVQLKAV